MGLPHDILPFLGRLEVFTVWESLFWDIAIGGKASGSRMAGLTATLA